MSACVYVCICPSVCVQVLNAIPDQDTFYDVSDALEEQGLEKVIGRQRSCKGVERDLLDQFNLYEAMLRHEDGLADSSTELSTHLDTIRWNNYHNTDDDDDDDDDVCLSVTVYVCLSVCLTHEDGLADSSTELCTHLDTIRWNSWMN